MDAPKRKRSTTFICKCGKLRVTSNSGFDIYLKVTGSFRLGRQGQLGLVDLICVECGKPPKG